MLFFGFYLLFAKAPEKAIFENYLRSQRIMGSAMLLLVANYSIHFFFGIRFVNVNAAIMTNPIFCIVPSGNKSNITPERTENSAHMPRWVRNLFFVM